MDKKDEKTFADLFSNSASKEEKEEQTFSNLLKNENNEVESSKDQSNPSITFDNLFEHITNEESQEKKQTDANLFKEAVKKQEDENSDDLTKEIFPQNANNFISNLETAPPKTDSSKEEELKITNPFLSNQIFFNQEGTHEQPMNEHNPIKERTPKEEVTENPLFSTDTSISNKESFDPETNPFFSNSITPTEKSPQDIKNPFLNTEEKTESVESKKDITLQGNPFFNDNNDKISSVETSVFQKKEEQLKPNPEEENPFFKNSNTLDINNTAKLENNTKISTESIQESQSLDDRKEVDDLKTPKSTSPFFEEEPKKEVKINPFFQNQINLVENKQPANPKTNIDISKAKHYDVKIVKKKEPLIKFILGVISYAIFIFLLLIGITLLIYVLDIKIRAAKGDYSTPTFNAYVVLTGSMLPEIQVYDVVITKKVEPANLKEGDIITFASADSRFLGTIITHRIIKKNYDDESKSYNFQTKGDYNNVADSALVPEKNIYGKVILKIPKLGYLQEFLASDGGWIIVILIPCLVVISYDIVKLTKGLKRKKYKNIKVQK